MPGIQRDAAGPYVQFKGPDGKRRKFRLTGLSDRDADRFAEKLTELLHAVKSGSMISERIAAWTAKLGSDHAAKLAEYGLLPRRETADERPRLGPFLDGYLAKRTDVKGSTAIFYRQTQRNLVAYFGADRELQSVTAGDADEFRLWLLTKKTKGQGLGEVTANRRCSLAAQFFTAAVRKEFITANPFEGVAGGVKSNKERMYFVTREEADKVLEECPDQEWSLIFALSRFGGLRTPSEHYRLLLNEIDWARDRFLVHSPKTEHHRGGKSRWVPLFPELRPLLLYASETAAPGDTHVIRRYRNQASLRTRFEKIIRRAGLTPWPRLFQNLRSTRETELAAKYPLHIVCAWLGNKATIAAEHYLQVTDADFAVAAAKVNAGAFLAHTCANRMGQDGTSTRRRNGNVPLLPAVSQIASPCPIDVMSGKGPQVSGSTAGKTHKLGMAGASLGSFPADEELRQVVAAWPDLSTEMRSVIVRLVEPTRTKPR